MTMHRKWKWLAIAPAILAGFLALAAVGGWVVMQLWNWLVPPIIGWESITFWQALGLLVLCRILFGGHSFGSHRRRRTPEERERFRHAMQTRFGCAGPAAGERQ
jgi:hypothetical protein